ncbi:MAG: creatininase family protein [Bacteroidota bacterium]
MTTIVWTDRPKRQIRLVFNSHGGNNFKPLLRELGLNFPDMFISLSNWPGVVDKSAFFEEEGDHADEMETSLVLYLKPELVLPREDWGKGGSKKHRIKAFSEGWAWAERKWSEISEDTGVGNPEFSSREKGEQFFKAVTEKMGKFFLELSKADPDDLYE